MKQIYIAALIAITAITFILAMFYKYNKNIVIKESFVDAEAVDSYGAYGSDAYGSDAYGSDAYGSGASELTYSEKSYKINSRPPAVNVDIVNASGSTSNANANINTIAMTKKPEASVSAIITDNCSTQSLLSSEYANDICTMYEGNYEILDKKCKALSTTNCTIPSCCILLNGTKCVAGNANGPTYLTDQGNTVDYDYYNYRGTIYPENYNVKPTAAYLQKCGKVSSNGTHVSKACMVQMFNDAGCPNKNPDSINDAYVDQHNQTSKRIIQGKIITMVKNLKNKMQTGDDDSRILCNGKTPNKLCDDYSNRNYNIPKKCMIEMFNNAGCPNTNPSLINDEFVNTNSFYIKKNLKSFMTSTTNVIKNLADTAPKGSDAQLDNRIICYGK